MLNFHRISKRIYWWGNKLDVREVDAPFIVLGQRKIRIPTERLETILDDVSRWYNVTVFYEQSSVKDILFFRNYGTVCGYI